MSNSLDKQYTDLLQDILDNGTPKSDRTGTGTISVFGRQIRHKMSEGFPLLTTKKMPFKTIVTELLWFLRGDTNIKYLVDNNCHIWDGDAYKNFCNSHTEIFVTQKEFIERIKDDNEFAEKWGELGSIYGKQWRNWTGFQQGWNEMANTEYSNDLDTKGIDQIQNLINDLKTNPDSRRLMVNAWNVGELDAMVLPPCHYGFQVYTRELSLGERIGLFSKNVNGEHIMKYADSDGLDVWNEVLNKHNIPTRAISLMWNQRSCDLFLGIPFNIASYGLLLEIIAKEVNMVPDELIGNLGDVHLYSNHIEQAKEQIGRELTLGERNDLLYTKIGGNHKRENCFSDEEFERETLTDCKAFNIPNRTREPFTLPKLMICNDMRRTDGFKVPFDELDHSLLKLIDYQSHPTIKAPLSN